MPRIKSEKQYNSFVKGLVTEASPLTFPEGASVDEDNFVLNRDGSRSRRLGIDLEDGYALVASGKTGTQICQFFKWEFAGDSTHHLGVVRIDDYLWFVDMTQSSMSASLKNQGNSLFLPNLSGRNAQFTSINNKLIVVCGVGNPTLIKYNQTTDTISYTYFNIKVRDFWGVDDGLGIEDRPATLSNTHHYNLKNQGWTDKIESTCGTTALECTKSRKGVYPSNADIWTFGRQADPSASNYQKYHPDFMFRDSFNASQAPLGKIIIDAFYRGNSRLSETSIVGLPLDSEGGRPSTVATYAGRIFYAGVDSVVTGSDARSPNYSGYIFFTQLVKSDDTFGKCYQDADPTSEDISDVIDTDGGTIHIPEAVRIVALRSYRNSLLVFAENGIWEIFGSGDTGFKATDYQVSKVTSFGINNQNSIVETADALLFWAKSGIYALAPGQVSGRPEVQSISISTIQTFYNNLPENARKTARGYFDEKNNCARWLYNDDTAYDGTYSKFTKEIILDATLGAFYLHSVATANTYIVDYAPILSFINSALTDDVYVSTDAVLVGTDQVQVSETVPEPRESNTNYLCFNTVGSFSFANYQNRDFVDWFKVDGGHDYESYLVTGYELFGDVLRKKQVPYILFYFERTEDGFTEVSGALEIDHPSSCLVQAQWGWANSANSGKWGTEFQAYRFLRNYIPTGSGDTFDYGESVIITKNKLRGSGKALSLKIRSEAGKDMKLLGWAVEMLGNSSP